MEILVAGEVSDTQREVAQRSLERAGVDTEVATRLLEDIHSEDELDDFLSMFLRINAAQPQIPESEIQLFEAGKQGAFREMAEALGSASPNASAETSAVIVREKAAAVKAEGEVGETRGAAKQRKASAEKNFLGFDWGLGVGLSYDLEGDRIDSAKVVNGSVAVESEKRAIPRIVSEIHYFFKRSNATPCTSKSDETTPSSNDASAEGTSSGPDGVCFGMGPFVGIQTSSENLIDSFAVGVMVGWRRDPEKSRSFNLGLGVVLDSNAKTLADGFVPNAPLPEGETEIRFKTEDRWGALFLASFSF